MSRTIKSALPLLLGNICLLFLLLAGGLFSFTSAYGLEVNSPALLAGCTGFSVLFAILWSVPYGGWAALGLMGLDALAVWRQWEYLEPAAGLLWALVSGGSGRGAMNFYFLKISAQESLTPALLLLLFALAFLLGWLAIRERCWHLPAVIVTVPVLSALMSGILPELPPMLAAVAGWGTLLLTSLYNRRAKASLGKGLWLSLGGISALLLLLVALLPREGYERPDWATNARGNLIEAVNQGFSQFWNGDGGDSFWNLDFGPSMLPSDEIDGQVDLTEVGPRQYSNQTVLRVTGGQPGRVYLKGGVSAVYTGSSWEALDDSAYEEYPYAPETFPALTAPEETPAETLTIKHISGSGNTAYIPYRLLSFPDGLAYTFRDGGAKRRMDEYQIAYIPGGPLAGAFTPLTSGAAAWSRRYEEFVYSRYLDVPEEVEQVLLGLRQPDISAQELWPSTLEGRFQERVYAAIWTAKLLEDAAVYDLDVSPMEPGEDFVTHFLEEGRGYCVHFATAGALLLRMQGIPSRYVEGYAPDIKEGAVSDVRDSDAHAWVEIYLDGYGWYPVEMTPGRQEEAPDGTAAPEIMETEESSAPPEDEDTTEEEQPEEEPDSGQDTPEDAAGSPEETEKEPLDPGWLWKAAAVLLALAALYGGYRLLLLVWKKRREHPDTNRSVIYAYLYYQRFLKWGGPEEPELEELGRKAKFSQHRLTDEERQTAWACADHALAEWKKKKLAFQKKP